MTSPSPHSELRPSITRTPPRGLLWPTVCAVVLVLVVIVAPFPVASWWPGGGYPNRSALVDSLGAGLVRNWAEGSAVIGPDLAPPVHFWARFHVVKAVLAALLLLALTALGSRTWSASTIAPGGRRRVLAGAFLGVEIPLALLALLVLVANVQGAVAPLSSALGLLPVSPPDPALAGTIREVRGGLESSASGPGLTVLVHDFTIYHLVMAWIGGVVAVASLAAAVLLWRHRARLHAEPRRGHHLLTALVGALTVSSAFFGIITAGNLSTVARPVPALLGFFEGGH